MSDLKAILENKTAKFVFLFVLIMQAFPVPAAIGLLLGFMALAFAGLKLNYSVFGVATIMLPAAILADVLRVAFPQMPNNYSDNTLVELLWILPLRYIAFWLISALFISIGALVRKTRQRTKIESSQRSKVGIEERPTWSSGYEIPPWRLAIRKASVWGVLVTVVSAIIFSYFESDLPTALQLNYAWIWGILLCLVLWIVDIVVTSVALGRRWWRARSQEATNLL